MNVLRTVLALLLLVVLPIQGFAMGRMVVCSHAVDQVHLYDQLDAIAAPHSHAHPGALGLAGHGENAPAALWDAATGSDSDARSPWNADPCSGCSLCAMCGSMLIPVNADLYRSSAAWMRPAGAMPSLLSRDLGPLFRPPLDFSA